MTGTITRGLRRCAALGLPVLTALTFATTAAEAGPKFGGAEVIAENRRDVNTLDLAITSPSLDGPVKWVRLLLPTNWTSRTDWSTIWGLHGGSDDHTAWSEKAKSLRTLAKKTQAIVVLPETSWCGSYSDWYNAGAYGKPAWERYVLTELRGLIETYYRGGQTRSIFGNSMGGLGSLKFAEKQVGGQYLFKAVASYSGNVDPLHSYDPLHIKDTRPFDTPACGVAWERVWGDPVAQKSVWQANDPYDQAYNLKSTTVKQIFISAGEGTTDLLEPPLLLQNQALLDRLKGWNETKGKTSYRWEPNGGHNWANWDAQLNRSWDLLTNKIGITYTR